MSCMIVELSKGMPRFQFNNGLSQCSGEIFRLSQYILNARTGQKNEKEDEIQIMRDLTEKYSSLIGNNAKIVQKFGSLNQTSAASDGEGVVVSGNLASLEILQAEPEQDSHRSYRCSWCSYPRPAPFVSRLSNHLSRPCFFPRSRQRTSEQISSPTPKTSTGAPQTGELPSREDFRPRTRTLTRRLRLSRSAHHLDHSCRLGREFQHALAKFRERPHRRPRQPDQSCFAINAA